MSLRFVFSSFRDFVIRIGLRLGRVRRSKRNRHMGRLLKRLDFPEAGGTPVAAGKFAQRRRAAIPGRRPFFRWRAFLPLQRVGAYDTLRHVRSHLRRPSDADRERES